VRAGALIDGRPVEFEAGETILQVARRANVHVPTLCHRDGLTPTGGCRLCIVELGSRLRPAAACHTPLTDGETVLTDTPRLRSLRRTVLALELARHPAGTFRADPAGAEIERLMAEIGLDERDCGQQGVRGRPDESHPFFRFDPAACVVCRRCLSTCAEVQGQFVFGIEGRGADTRLLLGAYDRWASSPCVACGACVEACPTEAITDRSHRAAAAVHIDSVCGYCGVGCRIEVITDDPHVLAIRGVSSALVNRGHLCAKGRYAHGFREHSERLTHPLVRIDGELRPTDWQTAIAFAARRLREIRDAHGPASLGAFASARSTNEACYLLQKLMRSVLGSNNVDSCARVCNSSTAIALGRMTGTGAASACYEDIELARAIVVAGANPTEAHPVIGARIRQAVLGGIPLIVIDPRRTELAELADVHLAVAPGANVPVANALARLLVEHGTIDRPYLSERALGLDQLRAHLAAGSLTEDCAAAGVGPDDLESAARLLAGAPTLFVHGLGLSELTQGVESVMALVNLGLLTGSIGRVGAGMLPMRGQNNVQGSVDMGASPDALTGYQALRDPAVRERFAAVWGTVPPAEPGLTETEMIRAAVSGTLQALWVQGQDIAQTNADQEQTLQALARLQFLVVQDMFLTETGLRADVVFPAASYLEQDGTFTSAERRIQRVRAAVAPPGDARPDWEVVRDVARALGAGWDYAGPDEVMDEIAAVAPALFGGVRYDRLAGDGLQWPCPNVDHPGTSRLHTHGFAARARLACLTLRQGPEVSDETFPYTLITGRTLHQFNAGTMTRRSLSAALGQDDRLEVNPDDAAREGVADGMRVAIESRWGHAQTFVRLTTRVPRGTFFLTFHAPETHTNRLVGPAADPTSHCPAYKTTAVRLVPLAAEGRGAAST